MDFTVIKRAGLSQLEFASIIGVSRVTTNLWVRGKMAPHRYIKGRVAGVVEAVQAAVDAQELPLSASTPPQKRLQALKEIIRPPALHAEEAAQT